MQFISNLYCLRQELKWQDVHFRLWRNVRNENWDTTGNQFIFQRRFCSTSCFLSRSTSLIWLILSHLRRQLEWRPLKFQHLKKPQFIDHRARYLWPVLWLLKRSSPSKTTVISSRIQSLVIAFFTPRAKVFFPDVKMIWVTSCAEQRRCWECYGG